MVDCDRSVSLSALRGISYFNIFLQIHESLCNARVKVSFYLGETC